MARRMGCRCRRARCAALRSRCGSGSDMQFTSFASLFPSLGSTGFSLCAKNLFHRLKAVLPVLAVATLLAQNPVQDTGVPKFTSNTNLVVVDVYARDKSGKPVLDLKKEDFTILEDGKPQIISIFELQKLDSELLPALADQPKTLIVRNATEPKAPVAPAHGPVRYQDRRLMTLFFDFSSMQPDDQVRAQEAAIKFLQKQMTKSDLVSIMVYAAEIKTVEEFTDDRERLIAAIKKFQIGAASEMAGVGDTGSEAEGDDTGSFVADETEFNIFNTDQKLAALETAARRLSAFPEKKALI